LIEKYNFDTAIMDAEVDSAWICTQAVVNTNSQSDNEQEKINNVSTYLIHIFIIFNGRKGGLSTIF